MIENDLSLEKLSAGGNFLALLDTYGLGVQGAAWIYARSANEWRFYIVTSLIEIDGLVETHKRIEKIFSLKFRNRELSIDEIYLGAPDEEMFKSLASTFRVKSERSYVELRNVQINSLIIEHAYIYRLDISPPVIKVKQLRHQFDKQLKRLEGTTEDPSWNEEARLIDYTRDPPVEGTLAMCIRRWLEISDEQKSMAMIVWGHSEGKHGSLQASEIEDYINRHGPPVA